MDSYSPFQASSMNLPIRNSELWTKSSSDPLPASCSNRSSTSTSAGSTPGISTPTEDAGKSPGLKAATPSQFGLPEIDYPAPQLEAALNKAKANYRSAYCLVEMGEIVEDLEMGEIIEFQEERKVRSCPVSGIAAALSDVRPGLRSAPTSPCCRDFHLNRAVQNELSQPQLKVTNTFLKFEDPLWQQFGSLAEFITDRKTQSCPASGIAFHVEDAEFANIDANHSEGGGFSEDFFDTWSSVQREEEMRREEQRKAAHTADGGDDIFDTWSSVQREEELEKERQRKAEAAASGTSSDDFFDTWTSVQREEEADALAGVAASLKANMQLQAHPFAPTALPEPAVPVPVPVPTTLQPAATTPSFTPSFSSSSFAMSAAPSTPPAATTVAAPTAAALAAPPALGSRSDMLSAAQLAQPPAFQVPTQLHHLEVLTATQSAAAAAPPGIAGSDTVNPLAAPYHQRQDIMSTPPGITQLVMSDLVAAPLPPPPSYAAPFASDCTTAVAPMLAPKLALSLTDRKTPMAVPLPAPLPTASMPIAAGAMAAPQTQVQQLRISEALDSSKSQRVLGSEAAPTRGSWNHGSGDCRPCAFFHTKGCEGGVNCNFCHFCLPGEKKRRQKTKSVAYKLSAKGYDADVAVATAVSWAARSASNAQKKLLSKNMEHSCS
eukprot:TRINITY_DN8394_c0_g1_i1.p1 TRINITY_DN8394_c0_g1~~TRINITY_DN8394_c0_g1_i1.p1  ORF type:complete len:684 (-),score=176.88 TRINITY_DN8394_c0_g1_i1:214-2199(-)